MQMLRNLMHIITVGCNCRKPVADEKIAQLRVA
jgi:hypothetical protein